MSSFTSPLYLEYGNGRQWKLTAGFSYVTDVGFGAYSIQVPAGFETDFASIPRPLWNLLPPTGEYGKAAVIHDYLYRQTNVSRYLCDRVFLEAMGVLGVAWWKRTLMFLAVRLFGGAARRRY